MKNYDEGKSKRRAKRKCHQSKLSDADDPYNGNKKKDQQRRYQL